MTHSKLTPGIPAPWLSYIKSHARKYAAGMFSPEDAQQVAALAFLNARARFNPRKGIFDRYAKRAIRNALLNATRVEKKHWDQREDPDDEYTANDSTPHWAAEDAVLERIEEMARAECVLTWADSLPPKLAPLWQGLYARDMSQREFAAEAGVSQARISQRNGKFLERARADLEALLTG